jgi:uncharacterized protein DUF2442
MGVVVGYAGLGGFTEIRGRLQPKGDLSESCRPPPTLPFRARHGGDRELFLPFADFPWFRQASVAGILHVERPQAHHLYWPDLDIDLAVESILNPEQFPLMSREHPVQGRAPVRSRPAVKKKIRRVVMKKGTRRIPRA